jgi:hypothetical protein
LPEAQESGAIRPIKRFRLLILAFSLLLLAPRSASCINPHATLGQLKTLEILCFVSSWLPKGFKVKSIAISYDEPGPDEGSVGRFPLYFIEYGDGGTASFTIDSAREGIGDRNIMETEDSEETQITSPFGPMYLIYTPKGKGIGGQKKEIKANWASGANMKAERRKISRPTRSSVDTTAFPPPASPWLSLVRLLIHCVPSAHNRVVGGDSPSLSYETEFEVMERDLQTSLKSVSSRFV